MQGIANVEHTQWCTPPPSQIF